VDLRIFEIFAAALPNQRDLMYVPLEFEMQDRQHARVRIPDAAELAVEPIRNPVTGEAFPARIVLPAGFEYQESEQLNATTNRVTTGGELSWEHHDVYGATAVIDWSNG
jgi:hypothetical protein